MDGRLGDLPWLQKPPQEACRRSGLLCSFGSCSDAAIAASSLHHGVWRRVIGAAFVVLRIGKYIAAAADANAQRACA
jgi:hypothetical protein